MGPGEVQLGKDVVAEIVATEIFGKGAARPDSRQRQSKAKAG
jgi:hypothetical protein